MEISEFEDYRPFIKCRLENFLKTNANLSFSLFAKKLKISRSHLSRVLAQQKHLDASKLPRLFEILKLDRLSQEYFLFLFLKNWIADKSLDNIFEGILVSLKIESFEKRHRIGFLRRRSSLGSVKANSILHFTLCNLLSFQDFKEDFSWMRSCLNDQSITESEIAKAWQEAIECGLIIRNPKTGRLESYWKSDKEVHKTVDKYAPLSFGQKYLPAVEVTMRALEAPEKFRPQSYN